MNVAAMSRKSARNLLALFTALVAVAAVSASPAAAADGSLLGCGYQPVHPFMRFLDPLPYSLLPGGDFESGAQGWKLSGGARVVNGNESFYVTSARDSHSLLLPSGSSATSPPMCMGLLLPIVRYFSTGGAPLSYLRVEAVYTDASGRQRCARPASHGAALEIVVARPTCSPAPGHGEHADAERAYLPDLASLHAERASLRQRHVAGRRHLRRSLEGDLRIQAVASTCSRAAPVPTSRTGTSRASSTSCT